MIKSIKTTIKTLLLFCAFAVFLGTPWHAFANPASPVIQEIYYDAEGADEGKEFIELYGPSGTNLDGFSLIGINGDGGQIYYTVDLSGYTLPQNGLLVIAGSYVSVPSEVIGIPLTTSLQNGPDAVQLWEGEVRSGGTIIDALAYGGADIYGEGTAALAAPAGKSLSRLAGIDTDNNFTDF